MALPSHADWAPTPLDLQTLCPAYLPVLEGTHFGRTQRQDQRVPDSGISRCKTKKCERLHCGGKGKLYGRTG